MDKLRGQPNQAGRSRKFLRTPLGAMLGAMLERGGPGWELNTSLRIQAALITHMRRGEAEFIRACASSPNLSSASSDALRIAFMPWVMRASKQDLMDAVSNSSLPGTKIIVDWDRVPEPFKRKNLFMDNNVRAFWKPKREHPK